MFTETWREIAAALFALQTSLYQGLAGLVGRLAEGDVAALALLLGVSFAYGVVHAAGPGHGKALIAAYLGAGRAGMKRGVALSVTGSMLQALTAILMVGILAVAFEFSRRAVLSQAVWLERAGAVLTALLGAYLIVSAMRHAVIGRRAAAGAGGPDGHVHGDDCGHCIPVVPRRFVADDPTAPPRLETVSVLLAMASRPCTGAIFVLLLALSQGLFWAGALAALAIGAGTAITVVVAAVLTVFLRDRSLALTGGGRGLLWLGVALRCAGGLVLILFAAALLTAPQSPFGPMPSG